tara:strand:+ start:362 stop:709 length:348 start_codon:yes stop_codon:yes gene_type:complete
MNNNVNNINRNNKAVNKIIKGTCPKIITIYGLLLLISVASSLQGGAGSFIVALIISAINYTIVKSLCSIKWYNAAFLWAFGWIILALILIVVFVGAGSALTAAAAKQNPAIKETE